MVCSHPEQLRPNGCTPASRESIVTLNRLRQEIEPLPALTSFDSCSAAKVAPIIDGRSRVRIIEQLEGFEAPAAAWEGELLPGRMVEYDPAWLDALCLSGEVVWARLTPPARSAPGDNGAEKTRGSGPVRNTPIALLRRKNLALWRTMFPQASSQPVTPAEFATITRVVYDYLTSHGASFFADIVDNTKLLRSQVEDALAELVANGVVVSDSFSGLRALLTPGSRKTKRPRGENISRFTRWPVPDTGRCFTEPRQRGSAQKPLDQRAWKAAGSCSGAESFRVY